MSKEPSHTKTFSKGGALKRTGQSGMISHAGKGRSNLVVTPSNVGKLGKKA